LLLFDFLLLQLKNKSQLKEKKQSAANRLKGKTTEALAWGVTKRAHDGAEG